MRHRFSLFTTLLTFFVLFLGNLVTATGAQDACGSDWPLCEGKYYPDLLDPLQIIEYTHRLVTSGLGIVILINAILAFRRRYPGERYIGSFAIASLVLLFVQAFIGGLNVMLGTPPGFTTIDVAISLGLLMSLVFLTVLLHRRPMEHGSQEAEDSNRKYRKLRIPALVALTSYYAVVVIGAFFKHSKASKVYIGIQPDEQLIYSVSLSEFIYFVHGILGISVLLAGLWVFFFAVRENILVKSTLIFTLFIVLEIVIGFLTVVTQLAIPISSLHMMLASASIAVGAYLVGKAGFGIYVTKKV